MSYFATLFFCLIFLKILLVSTQEGNYTFFVSGGYRPKEHTLVKYIVSLQYATFSKYFGSKHFCAGSIINPQTILTSAHCLYDKTLKKKRNENTVKIVIKTPNRLKETEHTETKDVKEIILHPNYNSETKLNDIAILYLTSNIIEDNVYAQSIELTDVPAKAGMKCTVVGWGKIFEDGPVAADALYADILILNTSVCKEHYEYFVDGMLCAGDPVDTGKDACQGDSGGPLICDGKIAGVVSFGIGCGRFPGVYADIWHYRDYITKEWIQLFKNIEDGKSANCISIFKLLLLQLLVWIVN